MVGEIVIRQLFFAEKTSSCKRSVVEECAKGSFN